MKRVSNSGGLSAQDIFEMLSSLTEKDRREMNVFLRTAPKGRPFNVESADVAETSTWSFFGVELPCLVLENDRFEALSEVVENGRFGVEEDK